MLHQRSPGFGLTLVAETLDGSFFGAEMASTPQGQGDPVLPEDLGKSCAKRLLEEIHRVGAAKAPQEINTHTECGQCESLCQSLCQKRRSKYLVCPLLADGSTVTKITKLI